MKNLEKLEGLIEKRLNVLASNGAEETYEAVLEKVPTGYKLNIYDASGISDLDLELYADCIKWDIPDNELMYLFIKNLYQTEINWRNKYIKETKNFLYRKAKSLELWTRRSNPKKVQKINKEMIDRFIENENCKIDLSTYKGIVNVLYTIKNELENTEVA